MNNDEIRDVLSHVSYKPGWHLDIIDHGSILYLRWRADVVCVKTGNAMQLVTRMWVLPEVLTETEIVQTAYDAAMSLEVHEAKEHFNYLGRRVYNQHTHVRRRWEHCDDEDERRQA